MKLTKKQMEVLKALNDGLRVSFHPYMGRFNPHAHYSAVRIGNCTPTVKALLKRGLVQKVEQAKYSEDHSIALTQAGKDALLDGDGDGA